MRCLTDFKNYRAVNTRVPWWCAGGCTAWGVRRGRICRGFSCRASERPVQSLRHQSGDGRVMARWWWSGRRAVCMLTLGTDQGLKLVERTALGQASLVDIDGLSGRLELCLAIDHYRQSVVCRCPEGANVAGGQALERPRTPLAVTCDQAGGLVGGRHQFGDRRFSLTRARPGRPRIWARMPRLTTIQFVDAEHGVALGEFGLAASGPTMGGRLLGKRAILAWMTSTPMRPFVASRFSAGLGEPGSGRPDAAHPGWRQELEQKQSNETGASLEPPVHARGRALRRWFNGGVIARLARRSLAQCALFRCRNRSVPRWRRLPCRANLRWWSAARAGCCVRSAHAKNN
jgi:hypothetical protein